MILDALVAELAHRFQHEKRAQVCLWFDEKEEFSRLLPQLQAHLEKKASPPFTLLAYDPEVYHGQVWIKYLVYRELQSLPPEQRKQRHFVICLPLSEDRLDSPDEDGAHHLELLQEYCIAGVTWRVGGKRPTLFSFLRHAGVRLTDSPAEQRRLYEGGRDSLLAKYVAKFVDRPAAFWETTLTPELAQSRLVGDVDQTLFDLAVDPVTTWAALREKGLDTEFLNLIRERYGFKLSCRDPAAWVRELVAVLALTETFLGYGEPSDFPFLDRLPHVAVREHHLQLLRRWLRDAESRPAWDRWVAEVEPDLDLSAWAASRQGLSFGLPHLVRQRWERILAAFEVASSKTSETLAFFQEHRSAIFQEIEFGKASHVPVGSWALLDTLGSFVEECRKAEEHVEQEETAGGLAQLYVTCAPVVERQHLKIRFQSMEQALPTVGMVADRHYATYANALNQRFFDRYQQQELPDIPGLPAVTAHLRDRLWSKGGKRAVIIVDALRYDCAHEIKYLLAHPHIEVEALRAALPTITPIGMTALMPPGGARLSLEVQGNALRPRLNGQDMAVRENRIAFLTAFGADCREIGEVEEASAPPRGLGDLLVVFGHEEMDQMGHGSGDTLIRHLDREVERLARLIRKLHRWGYPAVHVVTDHGFVLLDEAKLPPKVPCKKEWCYVLKERFALVPPGADLPVKSFPCEWDESVQGGGAPWSGLLQSRKILFPWRGGTAGAGYSPPDLAGLAPGAAHWRRGGADDLRADAGLGKGHPAGKAAGGRRQQAGAVGPGPCRRNRPHGEPRRVARRQVPPAWGATQVTAQSRHI